MLFNSRVQLITEGKTRYRVEKAPPTRYRVNAVLYLKHATLVTLTVSSVASVAV